MTSTRPGPVRATIESVARHAGVSRQTVSNAVHTPERLRPSTLLRVQRSIQELGYRPDLLARALRSRSTRAIGLYLPAGGTPGIDPLRLITALGELARSQDRQLVLVPCPGPEREEIALESVRNHAVDGLVLCDPALARVLSSDPLLAGTPHVLVGLSDGQRLPVPRVSVDTAAATRLAVSALAGAGHRRIALLHDADDPAAPVRREAWEAELVRRGLPRRGLRAVIAEDGPGADSGIEQAWRRLGSSGATAFVCTSDLSAAQLLYRLHAAGAPDPHRAIIGFGGTPLTGRMAFALRSVCPAYRRMAELALSWLTGAEPAGSHERRIAPTLPRVSRATVGS